MKVLLTCALLALTAATPPKGSPSGKFFRASFIEDYSTENRNLEVTDTGEALFEGDIVLTPEQRKSRFAVTNLWTSPVSFAISSDSAGDRDAILAGIQHWRDNTCIEFNEVADGSSTPHIRVIKSSGCWSSVGKSVSSGGQSLSIGSGCTSLKTVAHEFGHAMGLWHQQSRDDRDDYVTILFDNVIAGKEHNFRTKTGSNHSVPYDLTSMMHYGTNYFSTGGDTIRAKNPIYQSLVGSGRSMSHRDKQIANAMYNCAASCSSPPTCQNGGFVGKTCTCVCPPNTSGANCETLNGSYYGVPMCGDVNMTQEGTITSPNYPNNYPINTVCWWLIKAPAGKRVKLTVTDMKLESCPYDFLALRYTGDVYTNDKKGCSTDLQGQSYTSTGNQFLVQFSSDYSVTYKGFSADVKFVA